MFYKVMEEKVNEPRAEEKELAIFSSVQLLHQPYPWLMICDGRNNKRQILYSITQNRYYDCFISELQNKYITCSNKRWLVFQDNNTLQCSLLNISTMEKVLLPPLEDLKKYPRCVLSSPVMDDECRILFFDRQFHCNFLSCNLGDTDFIFRKVTIKGFEDGIAAAINFEEKLYVLTEYYELVKADFTDPDLIFSPIVRGQPLYDLLPLHTEVRIYLVESCGELLFIYTRLRDRELSHLKIFRADLVTGAWVIVESLGDRAIFLDAYNSFSSSASSYGLKGNCVYYVNKRGRNLLTFDLEDHSISITLPCTIVKSNSFLSWISIDSNL